MKCNYRFFLFLVLTLGKFLEALGSGIGTFSIFCHPFSLLNNVGLHQNATVNPLIKIVRPFWRSFSAGWILHIHFMAEQFGSLLICTLISENQGLEKSSLLSICTGILGTFDILQFEISSLMNWFFLSSLKTKLVIFTSSNWVFSKFLS